MGKVTYTCSNCGSVYENDDGKGPFDGQIPADYSSGTCSACHPELDKK